MIYKVLHNKWTRLFVAVLGEFFVAGSLKLFIVPMNLYSGYIAGFCQLINKLLGGAGIIHDNVDLFSILYFIVNMPLLLLGFQKVGRGITIKTIICTAAYSLFYEFLPTPAAPIVNDYWTACLLGGVLTGIGYGIILTCGVCGGGLDILGLHLNKKGVHISLGRLCLVFNICLYMVCLFLFNIEIVIYSVIFNFFAAIIQDRVHQQSINVQVQIFSRKETEAIGNYIMHNLNRGVTYLKGMGGFTGDEITVICVYLSKYEADELLHIVHNFDPDAFFTVQEGVRIYGNFNRKLT